MRNRKPNSDTVPQKFYLVDISLINKAAVCPHNAAMYDRSFMSVFNRLNYLRVLIGKASHGLFFPRRRDAFICLTDGIIQLQF